MLEQIPMRAIESVRKQVDSQAEIGLVLGSGLGNFVHALEDRVHIPFQDIPGFPVSTVEGHSGEMVHGTLHGRPVWVNSGRVHFYEGYSLDEVVYPIKVLAGLGVKRLILTNAAGSIRKAFPPGELMLITELLNLTGRSVYGPNSTEPRIFDPQHCQSIMDLAENEGISLRSGTYAALNGPSYETPAEIRFLRAKGADAVGMSTVHEALQGHALGMKVNAISCLTNYAAGILDQPLNHEEVMETGQRVRDRFAALLAALVLSTPS